MVRLERKLHLHRAPEAAFHAEQPLIEGAIRERTARKVRAHLRRMEPVVLVTPRWSRPQGFLEGLAMDLAVGEPSLRCRTTSLRHLKGRSPTESWRHLLSLIARMAGRREAELRIAAPGDRRGFESAVSVLLSRVQERLDAPMALLLHGAEYLPIGVLEDLSAGWHRFAQTASSDRQIALLLAGALDVPVLKLADSTRLVLADYGEAEAAAALVGQTGPTSRALLESAVRFTGGVPAMIDALGRGARAIGTLPRGPSALIRCLGPMADEVRGAVDIVAADSLVAERLDSLVGGAYLPEEPELDVPLLTAGLIRRVRTPGEPRVTLRAPVIGELLG